MQKVFAVALGLALPYGAAVGWLTLEQRSILYRPFAGPETPEAAGLTGFRLDKLAAHDGLAIPVWRSDPRGGAPVVVHFHGNGGGNHGSAGRLRRLAEAGFGIAAMEYRGYPGAPGKPTQTDIVADAVALVDRLAADGIAPGRIVLYGWSLGSAVALQTAARRPVAGLVLEAPPTALVDMAADIYPYVPVRWLMADQWRSREVIAGIDRPMLILHGVRDRVVPVAHGRRLAELAGGRAQLVELAEADHADIDEHGGIERMIAFIKALPR